MNDQKDTAATFDIGTVLEEAKRVISDPVGFYRDMPTSGGYANPIIFLVVMVVAAMIVSFLFSIIGLAKFSPFVGGAVSISMLIVGPIFAVIASFIGAAILFVIWKLMGSEKDYETAYRCMAYSSAIAPVIAVITFIPYIAGIVQKLWGAFLMYTASVEVHKIKAQTAKVVFGILAALGIVMGYSGEKTMRSYEHRLGKISVEMERELKEGSIGAALQNMENLDELTPEEAGKQFGEFMKGMEKFAKGMEQAAEEANTEAAGAEN